MKRLGSQDILLFQSDSVLRPRHRGRNLSFIPTPFGGCQANRRAVDCEGNAECSCKSARKGGPADVLSRPISSSLFFSWPSSTESGGIDRKAFAPLGRRVDRLFSYRRSDGAYRGVDQQSHAPLGLFNIVQHMADVDGPGAVSGPCAEPQFEKAAEASQIGVDPKKTEERVLIGGRFDGPIESRVSQIGRHGKTCFPRLGFDREPFLRRHERFERMLAVSR